MIRDPHYGSRGHLTPPPTEGRRRDTQKSRRGRPNLLEWAQAWGIDARLHLLNMHRTQANADTCAWHRRGRLKYRRGRLKQTPHTLEARCGKTLQKCAHSSKASGARPAGALAHPHGTAQQAGGESPIGKHQPLWVPNGYHCKGSGATVGDIHKGSLIMEGNTTFYK
jgi:hypothetical protein